MPEDEPTPPRIPPELIWELEALERAGEDEQTAIQRFEQAVARYATDVAFREFPALHGMSADQIRRFGDRISRHSTGLALEVADLAVQAGNASTEPPPPHAG